VQWTKLLTVLQTSESEPWL